MKKLYALFVLLTSLAAFAQAPEGFNYQATVRNSTGALIIKQNVTFKFNIIKDSPTSLPIYSETHYVPTDDLGTVNLIIGKGTPDTGTFSSINWGLGTYYLGIELNTGSGFIAMGTTQMLSVPYALYAKSAGTSINQGSSTIYITGDITDAQAMTQILAEAGPNTQNVIIENTTGLTSVDLSSIKSLETLSITHNSNLSSINLNGLTRVYGSFTIENNKALSSLSFPELTFVRSINSYMNTSINYNDALTSVAFPVLKSGNLYFQYNPELTFLSLPSLTSGNISVYDTSLTSFSLPALKSGRINLSIKTLTSLSLPAFTSGNIDVQETSLTSLSLPSLTSSDSFYVVDNRSLTSINIPLLKTVGNSFNASNNALSTSEVNRLLNLFNTKIIPPSDMNGDGLINALDSLDISISFEGQNPPAPPTGQGLIDKQALIGKVLNVTTD